MRCSRRDFGKLTFVGLPAWWALAPAPRAWAGRLGSGWGAAIGSAWQKLIGGAAVEAVAATASLVGATADSKIDSKFNGVQMGAITYSFRDMSNAEDIIKAYTTIGLGEMELMSNHAEALAGAPHEAGRGGPALREWRKQATEATFAPVRKKITDAGIDLRLLVANMNVRNTSDDDIEYAFMMAKALGVRAISTSTQVSVAKRVAPIAEKHRIPVGFHGHDQTSKPDEVSTEETFEAAMAAGPYIWANLDIGHFTAANGDAVAFIRKHHARITNLHVKDRKRDHGENVPFGQGDTPIREVLQLLRQERWDIPANIEFEYKGDPLVEVPKCLQFCKDALA